MIEDCVGGFKMNWLTADIFYNRSYTQEKITDIVIAAGRHFSIGVKDMTIVNNMWFDNNYGFRSYLGFQNWIKASYFKRSITSGIGRYLITYFKIDSTIMTNLVMNGSWLFNTCEEEASSSLLSRKTLRSAQPSLSKQQLY